MEQFTSEVRRLRRVLRQSPDQVPALLRSVDCHRKQIQEMADLHLHRHNKDTQNRKCGFTVIHQYCPDRKCSPSKPIHSCPPGGIPILRWEGDVQVPIGRIRRVSELFPIAVQSRDKIMRQKRAGDINYQRCDFHSQHWTLAEGQFAARPDRRFLILRIPRTVVRLGHRILLAPVLELEQQPISSSPGNHRHPQNQPGFD